MKTETEAKSKTHIGNIGTMKMHFILCKYLHPKTYGCYDSIDAINEREKSPKNYDGKPSDTIKTHRQNNQ